MFYYDVGRPTNTTNASAGTEDKLAAARTVANQRTAAIFGMYVSGRHGTSGGIIVRTTTRPTTANSSGTGRTPQKRDPDAPAASTVITDGDFTVGTGTAVQRQMVGCAAQGGFGGWFAATPEQSILMKPNGGVTGNIEWNMVGGNASLVFDFGLEFAEL